MKSNSLILKIFSSALFLLTFLACDNTTLYNKFQPIDNKTWGKENAYYFVFDITDTTISYDICLQIRNNNSYPYQNLWVISTLQQSDKIVLTDTTECILADDFGKWTGSGITLFQNRIPIQEKYHFPISGTYVINFRHGMRDHVLEGINDIGVVVKKSED